MTRTASKPLYPDVSDYQLPKIKPGVPIDRDHYTFDDRVMLMMAEWFPDRSPQHLRLSVFDIYLLAGFQPFTNPNPTPFIENQVIRYLVMYKTAGDAL